MTNSNPERAGVFAGIILILAGSAGMALSFALPHGQVQSSKALLLIGGLYVLLGGAAVILWGRRARQFDDVFKGQGLLASWQFSSSQAQRLAAETRRERKVFYWTLYSTLLVFVLLFGAVYLVYPILQGEQHPIVAILWFGFFAVLGLILWGVPELQYYQAVRSRSRALIHPQGIYVNGDLHVWKSPFSQLHSVIYSREPDETALEFNIQYRLLNGTQTEVIRVPVPSGEESRAAEIAALFQA